MDASSDSRTNYRAAQVDFSAKMLQFLFLKGADFACWLNLRSSYDKIILGDKNGIQRTQMSTAKLL